MPVYKYLVINKSNAPEYIEIEQEVNDPPLSIHPVTSEPIKRVLTSPTLTLNHSSAREKKILSPDHLANNGFSVLKRDSGSKKYIQTVGKNPKLDLSND